MSVLIKGMEMPCSCYDCQLAYDCMQCIVTGTSFIWEGEFRTARKDFLPETDRLPDCPLTKVTELKLEKDAFVSIENGGVVYFRESEE